MRVLIIGAGRTGSRLASRLCDEGHDVVAVDRDSQVLRELSSQEDILTVEGMGCHPAVLEEAGIERSDLLVAVTNDDEANILACACAKSAGVSRTVARISDSAYDRTTKWFSLERMGVDVVVSQREESASELFNILVMPGASEVVRLLDGRVRAVGVLVDKDGPLHGVKVGEFPRRDLLEKVRFIALVRGGKLLIPRGDTVLIEQDLVYILGSSSATLEFVEWASPESRSFRKIVIAGGGGLGLPLAKRLESAGVDIVLIERNEDRASYCSAELRRTLVLVGDAMQESILEEAGVGEGTCYVALTGADENNILTSILAKQHGAGYVVAEVDNPEYMAVVSRLQLFDRIVNAKETIINAILHLARWRTMESYAFLQRVPGHLLEFEAREDDEFAGKHVREVQMPRDAIIAGVVRGREVLVATGELKLEANDRVVVFALRNAVRKVQDLIKD